MPAEIKEYSVFILKKDLNSVIKAGMKGTVLLVYDGNNFEVEFVKNDGTNYEFNDHATFTIQREYIEVVE